jgi:hypothetical protein
MDPKLQDFLDLSVSLKLIRVSPSSANLWARTKPPMTPLAKLSLRRLRLVFDTPAHPLIKKRSMSPLVASARCRTS